MSSTTDLNERDHDRRDRRVVLAEDIPYEELALIEAAEVPAEFAYLDEELSGADR